MPEGRHCHLMEKSANSEEGSMAVSIFQKDDMDCPRTGANLLQGLLLRHERTRKSRRRTYKRKQLGSQAICYATTTGRYIVLDFNLAASRDETEKQTHTSTQRIEPLEE